MIQVPSYSPRHYHALQVAPLLNQIRPLVSVRDAGHVPVNDRSLIEIVGYAVTGRSYQFYSTFKGWPAPSPVRAVT